MTALILVKDASKDGGGVKIGNAIGVDLRGELDGDENQAGPEGDAPEPSKLT